MVRSFKSASSYHAELSLDPPLRQNLEGQLHPFEMDHLLADRPPIGTEVHLLVVGGLAHPVAEEVVRTMIAMFLEAHTPDPDLLLGGLERGHIRILGHHHEHLRDSVAQRHYLQDGGEEAAVVAHTAVEVDPVALQGVVRGVVVVTKREGSFDRMFYLEHLERGAEVQGKQVSGTSKGFRPIAIVLFTCFSTALSSPAWRKPLGTLQPTTMARLSLA